MQSHLTTPKTQATSRFDLPKCWDYRLLCELPAHVPAGSPDGGGAAPGGKGHYCALHLEQSRRSAKAVRLRHMPGCCQRRAADRLGPWALRPPTQGGGELIGSVERVDLLAGAARQLGVDFFISSQTRWCCFWFMDSGKEVSGLSLPPISPVATDGDLASL